MNKKNTVTNALGRFLTRSLSERPGELLPGGSVSPVYSALHSRGGMSTCAGFCSTLKPASSQQVVSERFSVKSEKQGPPAAPAWAWHSEECYKILHTVGDTSTTIGLSYPM